MKDKERGISIAIIGHVEHSSTCIAVDILKNQSQDLIIVEDKGKTISDIIKENKAIPFKNYQLVSIDRDLIKDGKQSRRERRESERKNNNAKTK